MIQADVVVSLLGYITVVSVAAERAVEMVKPFIISHLNEVGAKFALCLVAGLFGAAMHAISGQDIPFFTHPASAAVVVGLLASGGSGMWHDLLGIVRNFSKSIPVAPK